MLAAIALAERAADDPDLAAELRCADPGAAWQRIVAGPHGPAFTAYLRAYGNRALHDLKLETRTPRQEPAALLRTIRTYVDQGLRVETTRTGVPARRSARRGTAVRTRWLRRTDAAAKLCDGPARPAFPLPESAGGGRDRHQRTPRPSAAQPAANPTAYSATLVR